MPIRWSIVVAVVVVACTAQQVRLIGEFAAGSAAITKLDGDNLYISAFTGSPFGPHGIWEVTNFTQRWQSNTLNNTEPKLTNSKLGWPNFLTDVPAGALYPSSPRGFLLGEGFLTPGNTNGNLYFVPRLADGTLGDAVQLSPQKDGWFYHKAELVDVDGDGDLDILTCRATKPLFGKGQGELVWLRNDGQTSIGQMALTVVTPGPDVLFAIVPGSTSSNLVLVNTQFFTSKLTILKLNNGKLEWMYTMDDSIGPYYEPQFVDLAKTGQRDVLVITNHIDNVKVSGVYAYQVAGDPNCPSWLNAANCSRFARTTLATNAFPVRSWLPASAAPGLFNVFYPQLSNTSGYPWIALAGDGTNSAYLLSPSSSASLDESRITFVGPAHGRNPKPLSVHSDDLTQLAPLPTYAVQQFISPTGTIGILSVGDVDKDGWADIVAPNDDKGRVTCYTFAP